MPMLPGRARFGFCCPFWSSPRTVSVLARRSFLVANEIRLCFRWRPAGDNDGDGAIGTPSPFESCNFCAFLGTYPPVGCRCLPAEQRSASAFRQDRGSGRPRQALKHRNGFVWIWERTTRKEKPTAKRRMSVHGAGMEVGCDEKVEE